MGPYLTVFQTQHKWESVVCCTPTASQYDQIAAAAFKNEEPPPDALLRLPPVPKLAVADADDSPGIYSDDDTCRPVVKAIKGVDTVVGPSVPAATVSSAESSVYAATSSDCDDSDDCGTDWKAMVGDGNLEGCQLTYDVRDRLKGGRHYSRFVIKCPLHRGCQKQRGHSRRLLTVGERTPLAYLALWARAAWAEPKRDRAKCRLPWDPTVAELQRWCDE